MTEATGAEDTIVAIATPPGRGGVGIVRLSGPEALPIATKLVQLRNAPASHRVRYGFVLDDEGKRVDDALLTWFAAPRSYTGEEVVEIAAHGSPVVLQMLVQRALDAGARPANPGEFTERAFLNGRLDLTQAEAVRDLIDAQTVAQAKLAAAQLGGSLAREVQPVKQQLIALIAALEAGIDFAEDDLQTMQADEIASRASAVQRPLEALLRSFAHGRLLRDGLRLAIVGKPNAGKSSLFNRLLDRERAIVTPIAGTTRDVVSERLLLGDVPVELLDTAGLRETSDEVERAGVERSHEAAAEADLVLVVVDAAAANDEVTIDLQLLESLSGRPWLLVLSKVDLLDEVEKRIVSGHLVDVIESVIHSPSDESKSSPHLVLTSAVSGEGLAELKGAILQKVQHGEVTAVSDATLTNLRQRDAVAKGLAAVARTSAAAPQQIPHEMLLLDLYEALHALDELTGTTTPDDVLNLIFSSFCIGK